MTILILIDCHQLSLIDVMNSPAWLWADSWYHVHDIVKNRELSLEYITPISAYLWVLQSCEADLKRSSSVRIRELLEWHCLLPISRSAAYLRDKAHFLSLISSVSMQGNVVLPGNDKSAYFFSLRCSLITLSCDGRCWLDRKVKTQDAGKLTNQYIFMRLITGCAKMLPFHYKVHGQLTASTVRCQNTNALPIIRI